MRTRRLRIAWAVLLLLGICVLPAPGRCATDRPNIVWIVADDMSVEVGAYGDPVARTPNLDRLASDGVRFRNVFATSGTCAPSRAALITGVHATSIGAHHMRSFEGGYRPVPPPEVKTFTEYLRAAGYYTSNSGKVDYQFSGVLAPDVPVTNWDVANGLWRGREASQPFFSFITIFTTHESQLFGDNMATVTDPDAIEVPPFYPDTLAVRRDFARHYDNVAQLDARVGEILAMLEEDGVLDETIVFFFPDNGRGFPRDKRWIYDGGIHEPLIVRWPGRLVAGTWDEELVSFIDFAPTVLALAGAEIPAHMQGRVFLGSARDPEPEFVFAASDRVDEATDRIRAVRDRRYKYIRNYQPDTPYGQSVAFRNNLATMQEIFRLENLGLLAPPADWYFRQTKPMEELYDTDADPFELENLAGRPEHQGRLERMRAAHETWVTDTGDMGAIPEAELAQRFWPAGAQPVTLPPGITPAGGIFAGPVAITIRSDVEGASIAYTMEESKEAHWKLYTAPITVAATGTLRARAVRYGWTNSEEAVADFEINEAIAPPEMTPPLLIGGKKLRVSYGASQPRKNQFRFLSRKGVDAPDIADAPTSHGAVLEVRDGDGQLMRANLPDSRWTGSASGRKGYKYTDKKGKSGSCREVLLRPGGSLTVSCRGAGVTLVPPLTEPVEVLLRMGERTYCTAFGGSIKKNKTGSFIGKRALAPEQCQIKGSIGQN